ncbi:MAG TPA: peptide chain release factor N(5)-glutamine methyltransferase [Anaerolineales bacterium]
MPPLLSDITTRLASISDSPALDASVLIAHIINKPRTWVLAHPELTLTTEKKKQLDGLLARLECNEPLPYVLGHWEFYGLDFEITPDVLIPRPETELLVEKAIAWLKEHPDKKSVVDVGTGSGAVAVSLAVNVPDVNIMATDISPKALQVAKWNAEKHGIGKAIDFIECDLLPDRSKNANRKSTIDLLCANLPYVPTQTMLTLPIYGREPTLALDGGDDGFVLIRRLMEIAPEYLSPNAMLLFETEATLGKETLSLARDKLPNAIVQLHPDMTGRDRLLEIHLP